MMFIQTKKSSKNDMLDAQKALAEDLDFDTKKQKEEVLTFIKKMGASYLAEISWETGLNDYQAKQVINILWKADEVEVIPVNPNKPDPRLLARVHDQSRIGQGGEYNFSRKKWYGLKGE